MEAGLTREELELLEEVETDVHSLFVYYNTLYFQDKLGACSVEWSSARMTLCGGVCEFRPGGGCRIKLSEPLLKLRPTRDLKMVLLHEMIHAYMMLGGIRDDDPGGHGTIFKSHMARINASTVPDHQRPPGGYNITTHHSMLAEVDFYRKHHWRCERCGNVVKRAMNREPQEADCRLHAGPSCRDTSCKWHTHLRHCGGTFVKVKEPEGYVDKRKKKKGSSANGGTANGGASNGAGGGSATGTATRADGAPVPAKRPKKGQHQGSPAAGRPITDFIHHRESEAGAAAAEAAAPNGVLPSLQAVAGTGGLAEQQQQQQQQQQQAKARAPPTEPSVEERRRLMAEAAMKRLARTGIRDDVQRLQRSNLPQPRQQQPRQQQQQLAPQIEQQQQLTQQTEQQRQETPMQAQVRQQGQEPLQNQPQQQPTGHEREAERYASGGLAARGRGAASTDVIDLLASSQEEEPALQQGAWNSIHPRSPPAAPAQSADAGTAAAAAAAGADTGGSGAVTGAAVECPVCGRWWPPGELSNAQLNEHIDECLNLSYLEG